MSTANAVPETWELSGDDARKALQTVGARKLLVASFVRLRVADGFSHARSLAFILSLVLVQATIALVGLASALGNHGFGAVIVRSMQAAVPGPAGEVLTTAVTQAEHAGIAHQWLALTIGLVGSLVTASTGMGQIERALNRLYGVEQDRPTLAKYTRAFLLAVTAGTLAAFSFMVLAFGRDVTSSLKDGVVSDVWGLVRWPLAIVVLIAAFATLLRFCPNRRQPAWSWLAYGATVSVVLWSAVTAGLGLAFRLSSTFGATYGPLAGVVGLLLWAFLSSVAILYGAAVAAQLEAFRAGAPRPQDESKAEPPPDETGAPLTLAGTGQ